MTHRTWGGHSSDDADAAAAGHHDAVAASGSESEFGLTVQQLLEIQEESDSTKLNDMGGVSSTH